MPTRENARASLSPVSTPERIQVLLDPDVVRALGDRPLPDLRALKQECADVEHAVSYLRRLAQARIEILDAERARRDRGGDLSELVADLPRILGAESGRAGVATARHAEAQGPVVELRWADGREALVGDDTLVNITGVDDAELDLAAGRLRAFESELSSTRKDLHHVIDLLERELAARQVAGTTG